MQKSNRDKLVGEFRDHEKNIFRITADAVRKREFSDGKNVLKNALLKGPYRDYDFILDEQFSDPQNAILNRIQTLLTRNEKSGSEYNGLGIDLAEPSVVYNEGGKSHHGVEIGLYNKSEYDFCALSDVELNTQCDSPHRDWDGMFEDMEGADFEGAHRYVEKEYSGPKPEGFAFGISAVDAEAGIFERNEKAWSHAVFNALVAVEFHRMIHNIIPGLEVPHDMVVVVGQNHLPFVPVTFYRVEPKKTRLLQKIFGRR